MTLRDNFYLEHSERFILTIKTWVCGVTGRTGSYLQEAISANKNFSFAGGNGSSSFVDDQNKKDSSKRVEVKSLVDSWKSLDAIIDFSTPDANSLLFESIVKSKLRDKSILVATTGLSASQIKEWKDIAQSQSLKVLLAPNTSLGVIVLSKLCEQVAGVLDNGEFDVDLIEWHHRNKKDAPGGTAKMLLDRIVAGESRPAGSEKKIVQEIEGNRKDNTIGVQVLRSGNVFGEHSVYFTGGDEQLTLTHRAFTRKLFAKGAVHLTKWLHQKSPGFYTLESIELSELINDKK